MTKRIEPSDPSDVPPISDPAVVAEFEAAMPPSILEAQLTALVSWYGAAEVKRTLAKITTGAPKKLDETFYTWMAVELFRFRHPGSTVKDACYKLSRYAQKYDRMVANKGHGPQGAFVISDNPETIRRIHSKVKASFKKELQLRDTWQWQLDNACGRTTALADPFATGKEASQLAIREYAAVSKK